MTQKRAPGVSKRVLSSTHNCRYIPSRVSDTEFSFELSTLAFVAINQGFFFFSVSFETTASRNFYFPLCRCRTRGSCKRYSNVSKAFCETFQCRNNRKAFHCVSLCFDDFHFPRRNKTSVVKFATLSSSRKVQSSSLLKKNENSPSRYFMGIQNETKWYV